jgi:hypothetical protein
MQALRAPPLSPVGSVRCHVAARSPRPALWPAARQDCLARGRREESGPACGQQESEEVPSSSRIASGSECSPSGRTEPCGGADAPLRAAQPQRLRRRDSPPATRLLALAAAAGVMGSGFGLEGPWSVAQALGVLAAIITIHECGHFLAARLQGIHVTEFSIGFGPALWKRKARGARRPRSALAAAGGVWDGLGAGRSPWRPRPHLSRALSCPRSRRPLSAQTGSPRAGPSSTA